MNKQTRSQIYDLIVEHKERTGKYPSSLVVAGELYDYTDYLDIIKRLMEDAK